jgi:uncharacterized protein (UPF0261 family)
MPKTIALLGALDTKGPEYAYVRQCIHQCGHKTLLIDTGVLDPPAIEPDVSRDEVAKADNDDLAAAIAQRDRGHAVALMGRGVEKLLPRLHEQGRIALGGTGGTSVACRAMRALPLCVPKVMVSRCSSSTQPAWVAGPWKASFAPAESTACSTSPPTEWADQLVGGILAAGENRLEAAARCGVPAVVAPGCLDMVNCHSPATVPERFKDRTFYPHNPNITLTRTTPDECRE